MFPIVGLRLDGEIYGYEQKFGAGANERHVLPAPLDLSFATKVKKACLTVHSSIGGVGLFRYDLLLTPEKIVFLEVNSIPGLLKTSIACDAAKAAGYDFETLVEAFTLTALIPRVEAPLFPLPGRNLPVG